MEGRTPIKQCTITLTRSCNLRCVFCYAQRTLYRSEDILPFSSFTQIVDFCEEADVDYVVLTGGEPTLYPQLLEALHYIKTRKRKMISALTTNGLKLQNKDFCEHLIKCGIGYIDISLKGKDGKDCVKATQIDCYQSQMEAIRNISNLNIDFTCSIVLTHENINEVCDIARVACCNGAKQLSFVFQIDNTESSTKNEQYLYENNPFILIETFMSKIDSLDSITKNWWIEYSLPMCAYTKRQLTALFGKFAAPCQIHVCNGITFDTHMYAIPCNMYFKTRLGRLGNEFSSMAEYQCVWDSLSRHGDELSWIRRMPSPNCYKCEHFKQCMGGCPVTWWHYDYSSLMRFKSTYYGEQIDEA